jgi:hypothetical protein
MRTSTIIVTALVISLSLVSFGAKARTPLGPGTRKLIQMHRADRDAAQNKIRAGLTKGDPNQYIQGRMMKSGYALRKSMTLMKQGKTRQADRLLKAANRYDANTRVMADFASKFPQRSGGQSGGILGVWLEAYKATLGAANAGWRTTTAAQTKVVTEGMRIGGYVNPVFGAGDIAHQSLEAAHRIEKTAIDGAVRLRQAGKK